VKTEIKFKYKNYNNKWNWISNIKNK